MIQQVMLPNGQMGERTLKTVEFKPEPAAVLVSVLSSMFLHGGLMHLAGNMWFLWIFGNNIEDRLGHVVYLIFYLVGGRWPRPVTGPTIRTAWCRWSERAAPWPRFWAPTP